MPKIEGKTHIRAPNRASRTTKAMKYLVKHQINPRKPPKSAGKYSYPGPCRSLERGTRTPPKRIRQNSKLVYRKQRECIQSVRGDNLPIVYIERFPLHRLVYACHTQDRAPVMRLASTL